MLSFLRKGPDGKRQPSILLLGGCALLGILLILWGGGSNKSVQESDTSAAPIEADMTRYQEYLEQRVLTLCESVGVRNASAVVTLESGFVSVYATERAGENEEYVILGNGSGAHALLLSQTAPPIMGIGIVCHTPISDTARAELITLLSSAFHTPTNRIYVTVANR